MPPFLELKNNLDADFGDPNITVPDVKVDTLSAVYEAHLWNLKDGIYGTDITSLIAHNVHLVVRDTLALEWIEVKSDGVINPDGLTMTDDAFADFIPIGGDVRLPEWGEEVPDKVVKVGDIPPNCARKLYFRVRLPNDANPNALTVNVDVKVEYA